MSEFNWDMETDLLVAGGGPGGMTAALVASIEGLDVVVCEKSAQIGGTGATSAGTLWIPGNKPSRDAGFQDSPEEAAKYLDALIGDDGTSACRRAYLADGPDVIDYLMDKTDVQFLPCGLHPDYRNNVPGAASSGRAIIPQNFDGRLLGRDFERVRPPIPEFMLMGGMMVGKVDIAGLLGRYKSLSACRHSAGIVLRYLADRMRYRRGTRLVMGNALVARLFYSLKKHDVPVLFESPVEDFVKEGEVVVGAVLGTGDGPRRIRAKRGIVLATGGFAHNPKYREAFMPDPTPHHSMAAHTNPGDGLALAETVNAAIDSKGHQSAGFWTPVSVTKRHDGSEGLYPHLAMDRAKPGLVAVNAAGRRFVNEAVSYHDFVEAMYRSHETVDTMPSWLICETSFITKYGLGAIHPETRYLSMHSDSGYVTVAENLEVLAAKIGVDADGLRDTVVRHNGFARAGVDEDFGKGDLELNRFNGDPEHSPNPCLAPIENGPFAAMAVWPAEIGCSVGLATNPDCQVLDAQNTPIPGLYACGNDMGSVMAGAYPGPGTTLGPAIVFGWRAAMHAAGHPSRRGVAE
ncbi:MAG: FAD-binding protein [Pseudomonadota bacterium]|nr:FAD-binding protein [Pseudomonadota bacterium]